VQNHAERNRSEPQAKLSTRRQDRDSAAALIEVALQKYPRLRKIFADGGYAGPKRASQLVGVSLELEIVKRTERRAASRSCAAAG